MDVIGLYAQLACIWEATARKPGNVHRYYDFTDTHYVDFLASAAAIAPVLAAVAQGEVRVGAAIREAVRRTQLVAPSNTNLGIVLLLTPLAAVPRDCPLRDGIGPVLDGINLADTAMVYEAIRLANPGGLGRAAEQDVHDEPTQPLRQAMALAADRDLIARQYANGFREVLDEGVPALVVALGETECLETAIVLCQLRLLADHPDSLIARKRGPGEAAEASARARRVLNQGRPDTPDEPTALTDLDAWLREDGHGRNPGTTADLVAASLFVALREGMITLPQTFTSRRGGSESAHD